nr:hypothetical protein HK105_007359 [Polyrhizophydium stewartii]
MTAGRAPATREERVLEYVLANARRGDPAHVLQTIDEFARTDTLLMNVGDVKGAIIEELIDEFKPTNIAELGTYIGYSAIRFSRKLSPGGKYVSFDVNPRTTAIARSIAEHAGLANRIDFVVGPIGQTHGRLAELGISTVDIFELTGRGRYPIFESWY